MGSLPVAANAQMAPRAVDRSLLDANGLVPTASVPPLRLSGPIDPARYRVGPGDVFSLIMYGPLYRETRLTVSAEGVLFSPNWGPSRPTGSRSPRSAHSSNAGCAPRCGASASSSSCSRRERSSST
jgi:protein involved in polysaccharide export with SLBB domain